MHSEPLNLGIGDRSTHAKVVWEVDTHRIVRLPKNDRFNPNLYVLEAFEGKDATGQKRWRPVTNADDGDTFPVLLRAIAYQCFELEELQSKYDELKAKSDG